MDDFLVLADESEEEDPIEKFLNGSTENKINTVPTEVLLIIFSKLSLLDQSLKIPAVCTFWKRICNVKIGHENGADIRIIPSTRDGIIYTKGFKGLYKWSLEEKRVVELVRTQPKVIIREDENVIYSYKGILQVNEFHKKTPIKITFPNINILYYLFPKNGYPIACSINHLYLFNINPFHILQTELLTRTPNGKHFAAKLFPGDKFGCVLLNNNIEGIIGGTIFIFETKSIQVISKIQADFILQVYGSVQISEDGLRMCILQACLVILQRESPTENLSEEKSHTTWALRLKYTCKFCKKLAVNQDLSLIADIHNLKLMDLDLNELWTNPNPETNSQTNILTWITNNKFVEFKVDSLVLYKVENKQVTSLKLENNQTIAITSIQRISPTSFGTVHGNGTIRIWNSSTLNLEYKLSGNILQEGFFEKLGDDHFAIIHNDDDVIVYKVTELGACCTYTIPLDQKVLGIQTLKDTAITWNLKTIVKWEIQSGKIIERISISPKLPLYEILNFQYLDEDFICISSLSLFAYFSRNPNIFDLKCCVGDSFVIESEGGWWTVFTIDQTNLFGKCDNFFYILKDKIALVFDWNSKKLLYEINTSHPFYHPVILSCSDNCLLISDSSNFIKINLKTQDTQLKYSSVIKFALQSENNNLLLYERRDTMGFSLWDTQSWIELSWVQFSHYKILKLFYPMEFGLVLAHDGKWLVSFNLSETLNIKKELSGFKSLIQNSVVLSKDRRRVIVKTKMGIHIGEVILGKRGPELKWNFVDQMNSGSNVKKDLLYFESRGLVVSLGETCIYSYFVDCDIQLSSIATKSQ